jgi:hypothetical protein
MKQKPNSDQVCPAFVIEFEKDNLGHLLEKFQRILPTDNQNTEISDSEDMTLLPLLLN